jgi:hypothetical protein
MLLSVKTDLREPLTSSQHLRKDSRVLKESAESLELDYRALKQVLEA